MLDFEAARAQILEKAKTKRLSGERVALVDALFRVTHEAIVGPVDLPENDHSAMDGYAVRVADCSAEGVTTLAVEGESRAGVPLAALGAGVAARIFTGAHLPEGADAVVMQENVTRDERRITFEKTPRRYENVRRRGEDLRIGAVALESGVRLSGFQLGLLAMLDQAEVLVTRKPKVRILCTGDELRAVGDVHEAGIPDSNSVAIAALARAAGAVVEVCARVTDDFEALKVALSEGANGADLLVTIGGVSVGDHDLVKPALAAIGAETGFWKVAMKPGKPLLFGELGDALVLGLPGNPASAQVTFSLFGIPLIKTLLGDRMALPMLRSAVLNGEFRQKPGRTNFLRGRLEGETVTILGNQSSGAGTAMAWANALVVVPSECTLVEPGARIEVFAFADL